MEGGNSKRSCFPPLLILGAFRLNHPSGGQKTHYCHDAVSLMIARVVEFYFAPAAFPVTGQRPEERRKPSKVH